MWAAHPPCACPAIKAAVSFPTAQCQWTSFTVWGSACKSALVTLIRLGKCYPNSQHLLFDLLRERLSLSLRFPYFTKSNIFSNLVFQKIFKSKSTKEYKNCYPGPSGWTGNFLSRLLSLSLYVSVYVGIHVCLCMGKHVYMTGQSREDTWKTDKVLCSFVGLPGCLAAVRFLSFLYKGARLWGMDPHPAWSPDNGEP